MVRLPSAAKTLRDGGDMLESGVVGWGEEEGEMQFVQGFLPRRFGGFEPGCHWGEESALPDLEVMERFAVF